MKPMFSVITCSMALFLCGCAAITAGSNQSVSITTEPVSGANCELTNDNGTWYVSSTPGSVTVHREASDLIVTCKKGELSGTARVVSFTKGLAFGNIIAGGIIGAAIDRGNGAAFDYPTLIKVPMAKGGTSVIIDETPKAGTEDPPKDGSPNFGTRNAR